MPDEDGLSADDVTGTTWESSARTGDTEKRDETRIAPKTIMGR
ncbi:hypothetical protein LptCag_2537 [Leptospirillum ferriphilum]|uniref:Uncharacterized protein n=1 Tax=Leptospirillum ferriphilum TaxID=178606 RepID=A0A094WC27_9BACT|nr:hypothetical protein LptCag_2537 [Leptospirillum ferriphilum]